MHMTHVWVKKKQTKNKNILAISAKFISSNFYA